MYNRMVSTICCSVGLGSVFFKHAISSVDSGRFITLLSFVYLIFMSLSVTSGVLCVVRLVVVVDVSGFLVLGFRV